MHHRVVVAMTSLQSIDSPFDQDHSVHQHAPSGEEERLQRRSSLLSCCFGNACFKLSSSPPLMDDLTHKIPLSLPLIKPNAKCSDIFVVRNSKGNLVAVCQQHGKHAFRIFCHRPLSTGQPPSLALGGRILYKLGRTNLQDRDSPTGSSVQLWNGILLSIRRLDLYNCKAIPIASKEEADLATNHQTVVVANLAELETVISLCLAAIDKRAAC